MANSFNIFSQMTKDQYKRKLKALLSKEVAKQESTTSSNRIEKNTTLSKKQPTKSINRQTPSQNAIQKSSSRLLKKDLSGSKFRWLNEKLYTTTGKESFDLFTNNPEYFDIYHKGFRSQSQQWPIKPVERVIQLLVSSISTHEKKAIRIADLGCGEAQIAQHFTNTPSVSVSSFDLIKTNEFVTACDISNIAVGNEEFDYVIFCLSLMGTNYYDFLIEANRILKKE